jgi:hypothetical protein
VPSDPPVPDEPPVTPASTTSAPALPPIPVVAAPPAPFELSDEPPHADNAAPVKIKDTTTVNLRIPPRLSSYRVRAGGGKNGSRQLTAIR